MVQSRSRKRGVGCSYVFLGSWRKRLATSRIGFGRTAMRVRIKSINQSSLSLGLWTPVVMLCRGGPLVIGTSEDRWPMPWGPSCGRCTTAWRPRGRTKRTRRRYVYEIIMSLMVCPLENSGLGPVSEGPIICVNSCRFERFFP